LVTSSKNLDSNQYNVAAKYLQSIGKPREARKLLRANPNDNTGCRFDILAIKIGLGPITYPLLLVDNQLLYLLQFVVYSWH